MSSFKNFVGESGLKVLAMARLNQCEYSVMLYLLNCSASGLEEFITTERELSSLIGYTEREVNEAITTLAARHIIKLRYGDHQSAHNDRQSVRIGPQFDMNSWQLNFDKDVNSSDAIVFPFRRADGAHLVGMNGDKIDLPKHVNRSIPTWQRALESFTKNRDLTDIDMRNATASAKVLVDTHPVDQVLLMIRHFGARIPTLSLLASSWQHYQEMFEEENQKVDLMGARQKHNDIDSKVRDSAETLIGRKDELSLTEEEITVLDILVRHRHPRRQLFWAYQTRSRYPNLKNFFESNMDNMLPVTSSGNVIKKKPKQD